jgi:hypothetical protein
MTDEQAATTTAERPAWLEVGKPAAIVFRDPRGKLADYIRVGITQVAPKTHIRTTGQHLFHQATGRAGKGGHVMYSRSNTEYLVGPDHPVLAGLTCAADHTKGGE